MSSLISWTKSLFIFNTNMDVVAEYSIENVTLNFILIGLLTISALFFKDYKIHGKYIALQNSIVVSLYIVLFFLAVWAIAVPLSNNISSEDLLYNILFVFLFLFIPLSKLSIWYWRKYLAGNILIFIEEQSRPDNSKLISTVIPILGGLGSLTPICLSIIEFNSFQFKVYSENILSSLCYFFTAICFYLFESGTIEIRERGISHRNYYLAWKHIEMYDVDRDKNILNIQHQALYPISRYIKIKFAPELKKDLVRILSHHCR